MTSVASAARSLPLPIRTRLHGSLASPRATTGDRALREKGYVNDETLSTQSKREGCPARAGERSACRLDRLHGKELDRQLDQRVGAMRDLAHELQRIPRLQHIAG